ncbi:MAG TPA: glycosyltransferase family 4 protein [Anaerolineae bacterium]
MKIVLTIHHFPPNYNAGAENYTFRLASWLINAGHEVEVVCIESISQGTHEIEAKRDVYEGVPVWRLYYNLAQTPDPFRWSFENPAIGAWFTDFLAQTRPDLVHINSCYLLSINTIMATKQLSLPLIVTLHDFWFVCPRITLLKPTGERCHVPDNVAECAWCLGTEKRRFRYAETASRGLAGAMAHNLLKSSIGAKVLGIQPNAKEIAYRRDVSLKALKQADIILAPSEFLRSIFLEQGLDPAKILFSRYGLDTGHWVSSTESPREASEDLRITYIGQVARHKGVHLLVEAYTRLDLSKRRARLKIYGDLTVFPDYVQSLQNIASSTNGRPAVEFAGRFDNRRVAEILRQTDVIVVPSIWYENSPIAIMEALTAGTPVVTANLGGMPEMVHHNQNGLLFAPGDAPDLARQLQRLVDEPDLVANLAAGAQPVRMIDHEMEQLFSIYENLLP